MVWLSKSELTEEELKEGDVRLRSFIASMKDLVFILDGDWSSRNIFSPPMTPF